MKSVPITIRPVVLALLLALAAPGVMTPEVLAASDETRTPVPAPAPVTIKGARMTENGTGPELIIETSSPVTYTSYRTTAPNRLVVDFSQAVPAESLDAVSFERAPVSRLVTKRFETEAGVLTRMELYLAQDLQPVIAPSAEKTGELRITFPGFVVPPPPAAVAAATPSVPATPPAPETAVSAAPIPEPLPSSRPVPAPVPEQAAPSAASLASITDIVSRNDGIEILINGAFPDYTTMRLNRPERLVIDLTDVQVGAAARMIQLNTAGLSTARIGSYPGRTRVVLDAINGSLPDAAYELTPTGLRVSFPTMTGSGQTAGRTEKAAAPAAHPRPAAAPEERPVIVTQPVDVARPGRVEAVDFQVVDGISRISVKTSGAVSVEEPVKSPGFLSLPIKNAALPHALQRSLESRSFPSSVLRVTPTQVRTRAGQETLIRVALRTDMPYKLRREADMVYLEINNPVEEKKLVAPEPARASDAAGSRKAAAPPVEQLVSDAAAEPALKPRYTGRRVTLEFADAEVGKILQLLAEVSNRNFIFGDDVGKQRINMKLANVPWDQALAIILETNGLDKYDDGNVTQIRKKGSFKSQREEEVELRKATYKSEPLVTELVEINYSRISDIKKQFEAIRKAYGDLGSIEEDERTGKIIITGIAPAIAEMKKLHKELDVPERQVMIEARIVEASNSFTRSLGVNWGVHYRDGSASIAGINSFDTSFGGLASTVPPASGVSGQPGGSAGISFGTLASNIKLDLRLNAAATAGLVRIVSTPKVATLNRKTAKITQGQQIPYTSSTSDKVETKFVEAALALEVTPNINPNGTIVMKIDAKNDAPSSTGNPPAINKKQATTEMMLRDGETTVIGGIYVENESSNDEGVPFLQDVPWFGNLFKSTDVKRNRNELLIFITPRILGPSA